MKKMLAVFAAILVAGAITAGPGSSASKDGRQLYGDVELRGQGLNVTAGVYYGFVDNTVAGVANMGGNRTAPVPEVTKAGPYTWY